MKAKTDIQWQERVTQNTQASETSYETLSILTVDVVVLTLDEWRLKVLLHQRPNEPFAGAWALPGGFVHLNEDDDTSAAIERVLAHKVGVGGIYMEQLKTYSGMGRDPRGWSLSVAHIALVPRKDLHLPDSPAVALIDVDDLPELAFDHVEIIKDALGRLRSKGAYSTLPANFLDREFTLSDLQAAYESVLGEKLDTSAFRRKVSDLEFLEKTGETRGGSSKRPARLYRLHDPFRLFDRTLGRSNS
ncbi:NUDIX hydrolase [Oryzifoliimicrobium ureilyticus]|uniref:NUDIX hydrolase n=1 Tax=Oryzifoliimicrobium ureilyticus TaxID=3113724 RepID=UPI0030763D38